MAGPLGTGERKLATLMFADITGYTDMTSRLDPEDVISVVDPIMRDLQRVAHAHGGTVLMTAGDGVLCAFGVPVVREDDALRAVRAAADMRALAAAAEGTSGVHIGIASGEILISPDDSPRGWGITGLCVALASRLSDLAKNGEILADEVCRRLAGSAARWGPVQESQIQGMGERKILVAQLLDLEGSHRPRAQGEFIGRQVEHARLDELLTRLLAEQRSLVVSVQGEAGIGKTRLLTAWLERHPEVTGISGRCLPYGNARPLAGLLDAVLEHLRVRGLLRRDRLVELLTPLHEADALTERLLALASGHALPPAEDVASVLRHALRSLLTGLAARSPVALVVDDAHWAGEDGIAFLDDLAQKPVSGPLLVMALQREGPRWGDVPSLEPLPSWAAKQVVESRLHEAAPELVETIVSRTAGNPLFLTETLNLLEDGIPASEAAAQLPLSVRALLTARLDALPEEAKQLALVASAGADLARVEDLGLLLRRSPDASLGTLVARGVLVEVTGGGYRFGHRLFQEAAYAALTRSRRVELHLAYLDLLGPESPALRAFHAESAWQHLAVGAPDRPDVALRALTELNELGRTLFAWQARGARDVFERAVSVCADVEDDPFGAVASTFATYAEVLIDIGELDEALRAGRQAREAARGAGSLAESGLAMGHALARLGKMDEARDELESALDIHDPGLRGRALKVLALTWRFDSEERCCHLLEASFTAFQEAQDASGQAEVSRLLAYLLSVSGSNAFQRWFDEATASLSLDDLRGRALMVRTACFVAGARADWPEVLKLADEALALGRRAGVLDVVVDATLAGVAARTYLGDVQGALALREGLVELELPPRARLALSCAGAVALLRAGQHESSARELASAGFLADQFGEAGRVLHRQALAEVLLDAGRPHEARSAAHEAQAAAEAVGADLVVLQLRLLLCRIGLSIGDDVTSRAAGALADAERLAAIPLAELARVLAGQAKNVPATGIEARAHWFELQALAGDESGWQQAHAEWARLGNTFWVDRARSAAVVKPRTIEELAALPITPLLVADA